MNKEEIKKALKTLGFALGEATDKEVAAYQRGKRPSKQLTDHVMGLRLATQELEEELESLTTAERNPRYLVSRDGNEVGIFPGFNALMAINAARKIYGPGKYSSVKTGEAMFLGRGALQAEKRLREETAARAARKAAAKRDKIQAPRTRKRKANPLEKSAEHPIEVTRHYRSGGPNYLSPWQRAMAIGQEELFDTGIQMLPRVAERRAALFAARNPGATKRAYESGLKEATAAQLARLVRVGLRVGLTMAEIKKDVDATGRFTAAQIDRAMDQARSAEERLAKKQNPRRGSRKYDGATNRKSGKNNFPLLTLYKDGIEGIEIPASSVPFGDATAWQYALGYIEEDDPEPSVFRRGAWQRGTYGGWRWETYPNKLLKQNPRRGSRRYRAASPYYGILGRTGKTSATAAARRLRDDYSYPFSLQKDGIEGRELSYNIIPGVDRFDAERFQYALGYTKPSGEVGVYSRAASRRGTFGGWRWEMEPSKLLKQNPTPDQLLQSGVNIQIFATRNERARAFAESLPNGALKKALLNGLSKTMNALMADVTIFDMPDYMGTIRSILARQIPNKPKWSAARAQLLGFFDDRESNPSVKAIYQKFNGRPSRRSRNVAAPAGTPRDLAQLGRLRTIKTVDGRTWRFPGDRAPFLAADSRGRLHVVGGQYRANPAGEDCGEIDLVEYQTTKPHLGHDNETIYYHHLGEETGERPTLEITPAGELVIHGGAYRIEPEGLVN